MFVCLFFPQGLCFDLNFVNCVCLTDPRVGPSNSAGQARARRLVEARAGKPFPLNFRHMSHFFFAFVICDESAS